MSMYQVMWWRCKKCGGSFDFLNDPEYFMLINPFDSKDCRKVVDETVFNEVSLFLDSNLSELCVVLDSGSYAEFLQLLFSEICDPSSGGNKYTSDTKFHCNNCKDFTDYSFGPYDPYKWVEAEIKEPTYQYWYSLNGEKKNKLIKEWCVKSGKSFLAEWGEPIKTA